MITRGSEWRRWEPHIHAPGTVLNNQFGGKDAWEKYLTTLEGLSPKVEAIAVTDYYVTETYEEVLRYKESGRLPDVQLVFPNVELRLDVAAKSGFVNVHLLVSPEDPDHLNQLRRILSRLQFPAYGDRFNCTPDDLIALGKRADPSILDDRAGLRHGATQFKVNFDQLRRVMNESDWAKENILVAVAGGTSDGTSGVREAGDATVRQEIERFAHIIFSSSPAQREFWLGQRSVSVETLRDRYNGCKPCLHGSDSHDQATVGQPVDDRFSWIKGGLEFDSLRQACIDPEGRAYVGPEPPGSAMPSQVISHVSISDANWAETPEVPLNPGLVAKKGKFPRYRYVLVDETQDFGLEALRLIAAISPIKEGLRNPLCVVGDGHQRIYTTVPVPMTRAGIDVRGRSRRLKINYRTSEEIRDWAHGVLQGMTIDDLDGEDMLTQGDRSVFRGTKPRLVKCSSDDQMAEAVVTWVQGLTESGEIATHEICLTPPNSKVINALESNGLGTMELKARQADPGQEEGGIRFGTKKRIKGLEFKALAILDFGDSEDLLARFENYVAATRVPRQQLLVVTQRACSGKDLCNLGLVSDLRR